MDPKVLLSSCKNGQAIRREDGFNYRVLGMIKPNDGGPPETILHQINGTAPRHTWAFITLPSSTMVFA